MDALHLTVNSHLHKILLKKLIEKFSNLISLSIITFSKPASDVYNKSLSKNVLNDDVIHLNWISTPTTIINKIIFN